MENIMMRFWFFTFCILLFTISCSQEKKSSEQFRVALLSPGPVSDVGWNAAAYEGLQRIEKELNAQISQIETKSPAEFEEAFRDYARQGYALVFGHGFEFQDAAAAVAPDFPKTVFITTSGNTVRPNVAPMVFELEHATYLAGALAALMSKSGKLGMVGGMEIPPVESTFDAFEAGAQSVRADIKVTRSFIGNWEDVGAAKQAALALIDQSCDFLIHNADAAAAGVFQAAAERQVFAFGTNKNQNDVDPQHIIASCVSDIPAAFVEMAKLVRDGRFAGKIYRLGMPDGVVSFELNPQLQLQIPPEILARLEEIRRQIIVGAIQVPSKV
jgi:basic membrane lipoprotein Med (substrate-binding protein (PBP1-ABC) superfamily)